MARSAARRRERREAIANGATRKPPDTYQPSERAANVRAVMHEQVSEQLAVVRAAQRRVRSVPIDFETPPDDQLTRAAEFRETLFVA